MAERRLIINADDFGLSPGVTRGIVEAIDAELVTSTSVMVNMPSWEETAARLPGLSARASIGLHLNLVTGRPLTAARSLVDATTGAFVPLRELVLRVALGRVHHRDLALECEAQYARLLATGVRVTHFDSHRHVHMLPTVWRAVRPVLGAVRCRWSIERPLASPRSPRTVATRCALGASGFALGASAPGVAHHFLGISLQGSRHFARDLQRALAQLSRGTTELMVHPGYVDAFLRSIDGYTTARERELRVLTSAVVREWIDRRGIRLERFDVGG